MPIYEFICEECGETFEELVPNLNTTQAVNCPYCQSDLVRKLISSFVSRVSNGGRDFSSSQRSQSCSTAST